MLRVWVSIRITPTEIARSVFECQEQMPFVQPLVNANVCLHVYKSSKDRLGESSLTQNTLTLGVLQPKTLVSCLAPCLPGEFMVLLALPIPYFPL